MIANQRLVLFLASFLVLYFELLFIRWVPGQVRILGYFTNLVLIACFFGMGLGMMLRDHRRDFMRWAPIGVAVVVLLAIAFRGVWVMPGGSARYGIEYFLYLQYEGEEGLTVALYPVLVAFYLAVAAAFVPLGQRVGRSFGSEKPLLDYSVNLFGSIAGILVFFLYSWLSLPAWSWFALGMPLLLLLLPAERWPRIAGAAVAVGATFLAWEVDRGTIWSPYHKLDVTPFGVDRKTGLLMPFMHTPGDVDYQPDSVGFNIRVSHTFYQFPVKLTDDVVARIPALKLMQAQYELPYRLKPNAERVLIVGGGTGNDAAAALRCGARRIDVVDIDPQIVQIGKDRHPERPYDQTDRVTVTVDDARHFFHHAQPGYDVIVFALLDSCRLMGNMSSLRLDSYVFTMESFEEAKRLLKPDGVQLTAFSVGEPWMETRFYEMLRQVYGRDPILVNEQPGMATSAGLVYVSGPGQDRLGIAPKPRAADETVTLAHDDWPYIYARQPAIPMEYVVVLTLVVLVSTLVLRVFSGRNEWPNAHFFCLGAAFLLLETKNVTTLALVFGSTWYVNNVVFLSVLVMALLSNLLLSFVGGVRIGWAYAGLFAAVALNYFVPLREFAGSDLAVRLIVVGGLTALPVFFSGIVFAHSFQRTADPAGALGANVLGGVLGGVLEYLSMIFGLRFLFFLVAGFYLLSLLALRRRPAAAARVLVGAAPAS